MLRRGRFETITRIIIQIKSPGLARLTITRNCRIRVYFFGQNNALGGAKTQKLKIVPPFQVLDHNHYSTVFQM